MVAEMRELLAVIMCMAMPSVALAGKYDTTWNPPARFDHAFGGKLILYRLPQKEVVRVCQNMPGAGMLQHGCSELKGDTCTVITINKTFMGATPAAVLRHEIGHCNGWPSNHPD
jgi:hypothetical protein